MGHDFCKGGDLLDKKVSILIPAYNAEKTIGQALDSCITQDCPCLEIIVSDNHSEDHTVDVVENYSQVRLEKGVKNIGGIPNMNKLLKLATGDYVVILCADDFFTNPFVISDIVKIFTDNPKVGYIGRYYYQFIDKEPIRSFRSNNPYRSSDNWSGLAFRKECITKVAHKVFVETTYMVKDILDKGWDYEIIEYDTVAVRSTNGYNGSQNAFCYVDSPIKNWTDLIGKEYSVLTNFVSLIQIKNWGTYKALFREIWYFIKFRPVNILRLDFWFFVLLTLLTPKIILKRAVIVYKNQIGMLLTKEITRESVNRTTSL